MAFCILDPGLSNTKCEEIKVEVPRFEWLPRFVDRGMYTHTIQYIMIFLCNILPLRRFGNLNYINMYLGNVSSSDACASNF